MAAKIDLSWLAGLLTQTPTAANSLNPDYNAQDSIPYTDPVTGQTSGVMPNNTPYNSPSNWQRLVHPEQSNAIDTLNTQSVARPLVASADQLGELARRASVVSRRPSYLQTPGMTPMEAAASGQGDLSQSIPEVNANNAQSIYAANGGASLTADVMHNEAARAIAENRNAAVKAGVSGVLGTPTTEAGAENAGAKLSQIYNLGQADVLPTTFGREKAENRLGEAQATGQLGLLPQRLSLEQSQLGTQIPIAEEQRFELPLTTTAMRANAIKNAAESERMPIPPRYTDLIDPGTGNITLSKDPIGVNPFALQFAGINDLTSMTGKPQTFKDSNGKTYTLPGNALITGKGYNPLGDISVTRSSVSGPAIGGGSNNVTTSAPHDTSGSMTPSVPTQSSRTTLKPSITNSFPLRSGTDITNLPNAQDKSKTAVDAIWDKLNSGESLSQKEIQHIQSLVGTNN